MTIKPVTTTPEPQYPDKYGEEIRQALKSAKPMRWLRAPLVAGLLTATVAFGASGCTQAPDILMPIKTLIGTEHITAGGITAMPVHDVYEDVG